MVKMYNLANGSSRFNRDSNPFAGIRQKSDNDWYLFWLCNDPEFRHEYKIFADTMNTYYDQKTGKFDVPESVQEECTHQRNSIIVKYHLSESELDWISFGRHLLMPYDFPFEIIDYEKNIAEGRVVISLPVRTKKSDYMAAWDYIETALKSRNTTKRNRASDDPRLVYAIFKARSNELTFPQIFKRYQEGTLACYEDGPTNQFSSEESLERYYGRHKPDR